MFGHPKPKKSAFQTVSCLVLDQLENPLPTIHPSGKSYIPRELSYKAVPVALAREALLLPSTLPAWETSLPAGSRAKHLQGLWLMVVGLE